MVGGFQPSISLGSWIHGCQGLDRERETQGQRAPPPSALPTIYCWAELQPGKGKSPSHTLVKTSNPRGQRQIYRTMIKEQTEDQYLIERLHDGEVRLPEVTHQYTESASSDFQQSGWSEARVPRAELM